MPNKNMPSFVIRGSVALQQWYGPKQDSLVTLRDVDFEAARAIAGLNIDEIASLQDCRDSANEIVQHSHCPEYADHPGPFDVTVVDALDQFLNDNGFPARNLLTEKQWESARTLIFRLLQKRPFQNFEVTITETRQRSRKLSVRARSPEEAIFEAENKGVTGEFVKRASATIGQ